MSVRALRPGSPSITASIWASTQHLEPNKENHKVAIRVFGVFRKSLPGHGLSTRVSLPISDCLKVQDLTKALFFNEMGWIDRAPPRSQEHTSQLHSPDHL